MMQLAPSTALSQGGGVDSAGLFIDIANKSEDIDTIILYSLKARAIAKNRNDVKTLQNCADNLAYAYGIAQKYDSAIVYYKQLYLIVSEDSTKKSIMATTLGNLGICYKNLDKYMDMWSCFRQGKVFFEELHDTASICWTVIEMGEAYEHFGMYQQAREHYCSALALAKSINYADDIARCHFNIGCSFLEENFGNHSDSILPKMEEARDFLIAALNECDGRDGFTDTVRCHTLLALSRCYMSMHDASGRSDYADSSSKYLDSFVKLAQHKSIADSLTAETLKALLLMDKKRYKDALPVLLGAVHLPVKDSATRDKMVVCLLLSRCYEALGKNKDAYESKKQYLKLCNKFGNEENMKRAANFAAQTEIDIEREKRNNDKKIIDDLDRSEKRRIKGIVKTSAAGLVAAAIIALIIIVSLRKKNRLKQELDDRNDKLLAQRDIIKRQKDDELRAQSIILAGVEYASKIQSLAIGNPESVAEVFPDSFVYYRPRNIVSGDWYMATMLKGHRIMIEADCTGHGIPGALLSMLGVSALKDILNKISHTSSEILPGQILDEMRVAVKHALNKNHTDSKSVIDDGMDMTIVILPPSGDWLLFGGANQSAVLICGGTATRLKGDANPIGNYVREKAHFATMTVPVSAGDAVYLFSDGIQDQTGGGDGRKYSFKKLSDFLAANYALPMREQMTLFESDLDAYAEGDPQVDDRTLVGIRI